MPTPSHLAPRTSHPIFQKEKEERRTAKELAPLFTIVRTTVTKVVCKDAVKGLTEHA